MGLEDLVLKKKIVLQDPKEIAGMWSKEKKEDKK